MDQPTFSRPQQETALSEAKTVETIDAAIGNILALRAQLRNPDIYGRMLFAPGLDALAPRLARKLRLKDVAGPKSNDNVCILSTAFYGTGGHTRVAIDFVNKLGAAQAPILITTDIYNELRYKTLLNNPTLNSGLGERATLKLSAGTYVERILELYMMLVAIRPTRIVLMSHPMDIVAVAVAWAFRDIVDFVHHADHIPAIGASLPFSGHVDLTYTCHLACRRAGTDAVYAGMTSSVIQPPPHTPDPAKLKIGVCGSIHKFQAAGQYKWADYAIAALRRPGAKIVHIGPTTPDFDIGIRKALSAAGIDASRYILAGYHPDLPVALVERGIDVYLSSYPEPGGKANLEAMTADIPVIVATDEGAAPFSRFTLPLRRYIDVAHPDQVADAIDRALEMRTTLQSPEQVEAARVELGRFDAFVAGQRPASTEDPVPA